MIRLARSRILFHGLIGGCLAICASAGLASTQVLYNSALAPDFSYTPSTPGWLSGVFFGMTETVTPQGTQLVPNVPDDYAGRGGYSSHSIFGTKVNPAFPSLDRNTGFSLSLGFRVLAESHTGNTNNTGNVNRAGFSIILIGSDLKGIELGFQGPDQSNGFPAGRIFAQNDGTAGLFTAGENQTDPAAVGAVFDYNRWDLNIKGNGYALTRAGAPVLSGALRDYSSFSGLGQTAYRTPSYLFFGDNTGSALALFSIDYAAVAVVSEPSRYAMMFSGLVLVGAIALRRRGGGYRAG